MPRDIFKDLEFDGRAIRNARLVNCLLPSGKNIEEVEKAAESVGDLDDLGTTNKNSIVNALNEVLASIPEPLSDIEVTALPTGAEVTQEELDAIGLTVAELRAAHLGKRLAVKHTNADGTLVNRYGIVFTSNTDPGTETETITIAFGITLGGQYLNYVVTTYFVDNSAMVQIISSPADESVE